MTATPEMGDCPACAGQLPTCPLCGGKGDFPVAAGGTPRTRLAVTVDTSRVVAMRRHVSPEQIAKMQAGRAASAATGGERAPMETNPMVRFFAKPTRGSAIKAKCSECMGCTVDAVEPGFRALIRDCAAGPTSRAPCPLYQFRPFQRREAEESEDSDE